MTSNARYVAGITRFVRGQWRVWCHNPARGHYWGFPGDEHAVRSRAARQYRKVADAFHDSDALRVALDFQI